MKYFVSGDIHGFYDEWMKALEEKQFNIDDESHKIIVCGDLLDRGPKPKETIEFVLKLLKLGKIILVRGNHEDLALDLIENYVNYMFRITSTHHYFNGTFQTMLDLTGMSFYDATSCLMAFKKYARETDFISKVIPKMKNYYETANHVFVHSWLPLKKDGTLNKNWRKASNLDWAKARWAKPVQLYAKKLYLEDKTIVLGHWHCSDFWRYAYPEKYSDFGGNECFEPFITKEIIALDACTAYTKKVNVVAIEDNPKN